MKLWNYVHWVHTLFTKQGLWQSRWHSWQLVIFFSFFIGSSNLNPQISHISESSNNSQYVANSALLQNALAFWAMVHHFCSDFRVLGLTPLLSYFGWIFSFWICLFCCCSLGFKQTRSLKSSLFEASYSSGTDFKVYWTENCNRIVIW